VTRKLKVGTGAAGFLALFGLGAWFSGTALGLEGSDLLLFRVGLVLLGFVATLAVAWFILRRPEKPAAPKTDEGREIDTAVAMAKSRLASSRQASGKGLDKLPLFLILGLEGSTKTTTMVRSGLDPELLAGEVFRGDTVAPTRSVNLWYTQQTIFVEASGRVTGDPSLWMRLVRHLHPRRLRAALSRGAQAPRIAVVCVSCEEFLRPNSAESIPAAARMLRTRLSDLALELGTRVPVYALFTKADRLPHFAEYVRNFSREEAHDVLGATLPLEFSGSDSYAQRAFKHIDSALQGLFYSLASKRLKFLPRENQPDSAAGAYEFPREFRKAIPLATEFLVELCRPSQLAVSPVLRGFYFVGVRPVIVADAGFEAVPQTSATGDSIRIGATHVFNPGQAGAAAVAPKLAGPVASSRKIPQWVFLDRLFPQIFLADQVALAMTQGRRRVHTLRRLLLAMVVVLSALVASGFLISYLGNLRLQDSMAQARRDVGSIRLAGALPSLEALSQLDLLRSRVEALAKYERDGPPWHLRLGLYSGSALYPDLRRSYFQGFGRLLLGGTRDSLVRELRRLPDVPGQGSDYGNTYRTLKAYLIITSRPDQSTAAFLTPALFDHWRGAKTADSARAQLARKQFDFYAGALRSGNPYRWPIDERTVTRARGFLGQFAGTERIYRSVLAQALGSLPAIEFARKFPNAAGVVRDTHVVAGAFTKEGWAAMRGALNDIDRFFKGEAWVVGEQAPALTDRKKVLDQLRALYTKDYVKEWRSFLAAASVERFGSIQEGARRLAPLSGNQSPLLGMFSLVARNTSLDSLPVAPAFQPVHVVTPPGDTGKYIGPSNEAYVNALVSLQASLAQMSKGTPDAGDGAVGQALSDAAQARMAVKQLANKFQLDDAGKVHSIVENLMEAPINYAEASLQTFGPAQLNGKGRVFCAPLQQLMTKFPFNPSGEVPASIDEVAGLLQPGTGALWSFVENDLANYVVRQGPQFAEKPGGTVRISPSFIAFLNRAAEFSSTLWRGEGAPPGLTFTLRPLLSDTISSLTVTIDGQPARFTRISTGSKRLSWTAGEGREATLSGQILGQDREVFAFRGPWAIFELFQRAEWSAGTGSYTIEWPIPDQPSARARVVVNLAGAKPILERGFFSGVSCSGRITR
jgi:type VI secretion system protein ImpL